MFFDHENGFAALSDFGENNRLLRAVSYDGMSSLCDHFKNLFYSHSLAWLYFSNCLHVCIFPIVCMHTCIDFIFDFFQEIFKNKVPSV